MTRSDRKAKNAQTRLEKDLEKHFRCVTLGIVSSCCSECECNRIVKTDFSTVDSDYEKWLCTKKARKDLLVNRDVFNQKIVDISCYGNRVGADIKGLCEYLGSMLIEEGP